MSDALDTTTPAGIEIRPLDTVEEVFAACEVLADVWEGDHTRMPPSLLRALARAGNYAVGLYDGDRMIGASVAFFARPAARSMHSHITGVLAGYRSHGLGRMLKMHQRAWAFAHDIGNITGTFDPLSARSAHFHLGTLGARATEYLVDHYGVLEEGVNRGDETDRLFMTWALAAPASAPRDEDVVTTVEIPRDIEGMRHSDPAEAQDWRYRVRDAFQGLLADGFVVGGFDDARGYLFTRG